MPELIIPCSGGLDLQSDPTNCPPGTLRNCMNFEQSQQFGYTQCQGWSRYDGSVTVEELLDFYYIAPIVIAGTPIFGERLTITVLQPDSLNATFNAIYIGRNANTNGLCFAYTNTASSNFVAVQGSVMLSVTFAFSGATTATTGVLVFQLGVYNTSQTLTTAANYGDYLAFAQNAHNAAVLKVPGNPNSPVDATFLLNDVTYCVHDCNIVGFTSGSSLSGYTPQEGNILRAPFVFNILVGTILQVVLQSGDWGAGTAAGYFIVYDSAASFTTLPNVSTLALYTSNGVTNLGNVANSDITNAAPVLPTNSRALLYKTTDQSSGNTAAFTGWSRVPLSRELPYTQAYPTQPSGIGFGPATAATPFSIYEYSRQGLTSTINQLTPLTTNTPGCNTATALQAGWTNINNIKVNDGAFAVSPNFPASSKFIGLKAQGFNFVDSNGNALPPNTAIVGITVTVQMKASLAATLQDLNVNLIRPDSTYVPASSAGKANGFPVANVSTLYTYGGANDLWGSNFTLADLQNANFGVFLRWQNLGATTVNNVSVDFVGVTISYLPPTRVVYIRNALAAAPADIPAMIVHYTTDNNSNFFSGNATGTLTVYTTTTEAAFTAAGKSRVIGAGEQIRDAPGGAGNLLGWTSGTDYPVSYPSSGSLDAALSRWEWIAYNFYSDPTAQMAFGANGVEYGSAFDGTYVVRIRTGRRVDLDNPRHLFGYYGTLHLGYNSGDVVTSAAGPRPVTVSAALLSQAYNVGQPVVGFSNLQGQTLAVFCPRKVAGLQGTDPTNYTQTTLSPALGAFEYTVADVEGQVVWTSFRGVETMRTTNAYGNFDTVPLSAAATPLLQPRLQADSRLAIRNQSPAYAIGVRNKRQYRLYFKDGYTFSLTLFGADSEPCPTMGYNFISVGIPAVARHVFQGVRSDGKEVLYACWDMVNPNFFPSGSPFTTAYRYVARLDQGYNQDGQFVIAGIEFNPVYPYQQNDKVSPVTECQFQYAAIYASTYLAYHASVGFGALLYSQGDDLPMFRNNPSPYGAGAGPGYPYDNYISYPNPGAGQLVCFSQNLFNSPPFLPPPVTLNQATLSVSGDRIRLMIDASSGTFVTYGLTIVKVVVTYEMNGEARN